MQLLGKKFCFDMIIFGWILNSANIHILFFQTHLTFGKEFTEAVEMKQVAQQEAERARFVVEKVFYFLHQVKVYLSAIRRTLDTPPDISIY